eukprot:scaffold234794_cov23-Cyclotella_meneghiniana.AAC.1
MSNSLFLIKEYLAIPYTPSSTVALLWREFTRGQHGIGSNCICPGLAEIGRVVVSLQWARHHF